MDKKWTIDSFLKLKEDVVHPNYDNLVEKLVDMEETITIEPQKDWWLSSKDNKIDSFVFDLGAQTLILSIPSNQYSEIKGAHIILGQYQIHKSFLWPSTIFDCDYSTVMYNTEQPTPLIVSFWLRPCLYVHYSFMKNLPLLVSFFSWKVLASFLI